MNAHTAGKALGVSVALAVSLPVLLSSGTALAWYNRQSSGYIAPQAYGYTPTPQEAYDYTYGSANPSYGDNFEDYGQTNAYGSSTPNYSYDSAAGYTQPAYRFMQYPTPAEARAYTYGSPYAFAPTPRRTGY